MILESPPEHLWFPVVRNGWYPHVFDATQLLALELGQDPQPGHLLIAIAMDYHLGLPTLYSKVASLLQVAAEVIPVSNRDGWRLIDQAQRAAKAFADEHRDLLEAEHVIVALIDQGLPTVTKLLLSVGLDPDSLRFEALASVGTGSAVPQLRMPPIASAGTEDLPPLPERSLDISAWKALQRRQEGLATWNVSREWHLHAVYDIERRSARRLARTRRLTADQESSLCYWHLEHIRRRLEREFPNLALLQPPRSETSVLRTSPKVVRLRRPAWLCFTVGWTTWVRNRLARGRALLFRVSSWRYIGRRSRQRTP